MAKVVIHGFDEFQQYVGNEIGVSDYLKITQDQINLFADGFVGVDLIKSMAQAKYRPMGLSEGPDGSLYISESKKGKIWRVLFRGDKNSFGDKQLAPMEALKAKSYLRIPDELNDLLPLQ